MQIIPIRTRIFKEREDLVPFVTTYVKRLKEESVLAVTSKIVALSEGRTIVPRNVHEKGNVIRSESEWSLNTKYVILTMKDGMLMANAGIDDSNANGKLILLPKDSFRAAHRLRKELKKIYKLKKLGIVITDSRCFPLRSGVVGVALGYAGFRGVRDYRGTPDLFGRTMNITQTNSADSIATAAVLAMGEGRERQPLAVIEDAPVEFREKTDRQELRIALEDDMYRPLFKTGARRKKR